MAGLSCAIELAPHGRVAVLTKEGISEGSTQWAQGGIAAVLSPEPLDSAELHEQDTMQAGAGLCDRSAVQVLVTEGPHRVRQLIARGAHFDTEANRRTQAHPRSRAPRAPHRARPGRFDRPRSAALALGQRSAKAPASPSSRTP